MNGVHKIGYKVLFELWGELASVSNTPARRRYELGAPTLPREGDGPLMVYRTLAAAKKEALSYHSSFTRIYKCLYLPAEKRKLWYWTTWCPVEECGQNASRYQRLKYEYDLSKEADLVTAKEVLITELMWSEDTETERGRK